MTLIKIAAPMNANEGLSPREQGMRPIEDPATFLRAGAPPPLVTPHCRQCKVPVESFHIDVITSEHHISIECHCHGKTSGIFLPREKVLSTTFLGQILEVF